MQQIYLDKSDPTVHFHINLNGACTIDASCDTLCELKDPCEKPVLWICRSLDPRSHRSVYSPLHTHRSHLLHTGMGLALLAVVLCSFLSVASSISPSQLKVSGKEVVDQVRIRTPKQTSQCLTLCSGSADHFRPAV